MKKTVNYTTVFKRGNVVKTYILSLFFSICSWPRLLLEVFLRESMGERYFSFSTSVFLFLFLSYEPFFAARMSIFTEGRFEDTSITGVIGHNITWYMFLCAFLYMAYRRYKEIQREPSVFDFKKYSLSAGLVDKRFRELNLFGQVPSLRTVETLLEPGVVFVIGVVLVILQQKLGALLVFCSITYSLSYFAAYRMGDEFIMDQIDKLIMGEELVASFVDQRDPRDTKGFRAVGGEQMRDADFRKQVVDSLMSDDPAEEAH